MNKRHACTNTSIHTHTHYICTDLYYISVQTLHACHVYITLDYTTIQHIASQRLTSPYITWHCFTSPYITSFYTTLHHITANHIKSPYLTLHCITLHRIHTVCTLHSSHATHKLQIWCACTHLYTHRFHQHIHTYKFTLHYNKLHYITLRYIALYYITPP